MNKVKIFQQYPEVGSSLETQIDNWLKKNKVNIVSAQTSVAANEYHTYIICTIVYNEIDKI